MVLSTSNILWSTSETEQKHDYVIVWLLWFETLDINQRG